MCRAVQMIHAEMNAYTLEELADLGVNVPDIVIDVDGNRFPRDACFCGFDVAPLLKADGWTVTDDDESSDWICTRGDAP